MDDSQRKEIGTVLGRIPSGIFILTVGDGQGRETGMLCSWVQQAAFDPPLLTLVLKEGRYVNDWLQQSRRAILNLVGESGKELLGHFGRGFKIDEPAFEEIELTRSASNLPILTDALGHLECEVVSQTPAGDHVVHLLEVKAVGAGEMLHEERPMVHVRKNGFHY